MAEQRVWVLRDFHDLALYARLSKHFEVDVWESHEVSAITSIAGSNLSWSNTAFPTGNFNWIPDTYEAMMLLAQEGFKFIVISNQAGIARQMIDPNEL